MRFKKWPPHSKMTLLQVHISRHENTSSKLLSLPAIYIDERMFQRNKVESECQADKSHWVADFPQIQKNFSRRVIKVTPLPINLEWKLTQFYLIEQWKIYLSLLQHN